MTKVEIGICKTYSNYFALGISGRSNENINEIKKYPGQIVQTENRNY